MDRNNLLPPPITLHHLTIAYGTHTLLQDTHTTIPPHTLTALIGRNGTGKSTLLRTISGLNPHYTGTIHLAGQDLRTITPHTLARTLALVTTRRIAIPHLTARDLIATGRTPYTPWTGRLTPADHQAIDQAIHLTGTAPYAHRPIATLSDGEHQRIMLARALAQDTPIILLDEPTSFLDLPARHQLARLLQDLVTHHHKTILYSTHELDIALTTSTHILLLADHHLHHHTPATLRTTDLLHRHFHLP